MTSKFQLKTFALKKFEQSNSIHVFVHWLQTQANDIFNHFSGQIPIHL